jgi:hypothetical protein
MVRATSRISLVLAGLLGACSAAGLPEGDAGAPEDAPSAIRDAGVPVDAARGPGLRVVTFNTGTTGGLAHDAPPDDGYGAPEAALSDLHYGNGLAWSRAIEDTRRFFELLDADVVVFQEIFHPGECATVPEDARAGFVCESWAPGDPTVAQVVLGPDYQVACHLGKPDKCAAVHRRVGTFRGCDGDLCLEGLAGARVPDCGGGSRVGRGVIELAAGGTLTLVHVHGSSGITLGDQACRVAQLRQVFEDLGLGDGPAANGEMNLVMGDFNTDPVRLATLDESARYLASQVGGGLAFAFLSEVGPDATPTYAGRVNIDHVISDRLRGSCFAAGITPGAVGPTEMVYFDHRPIVCDLAP